MTTEPWRRVEPVAIPTDADLATALLNLNDDDYATLLLANLLPRPDQHKRWKSMWAAIAGDETLTRRTTDQINQWLETSYAAQAAAEESVDDVKTFKRITKFIVQAEDSLDRLDQPLAWAGPAAKPYNRPSRKAIELLADAIRNHRIATGDPRPADLAVWGALEPLGIDPDAPLAAPSFVEEVDNPLHWAPKAAAKYTEPGRSTIHTLVVAITNHRFSTPAPTPVDQELWKTPVRLGLHNVHAEKE